jgi:hypothetical protein
MALIAIIPSFHQVGFGPENTVLDLERVPRQEHPNPVMFAESR